MTRQRLFFILFFAGAILFAIFVWPKPEGFREFVPGVLRDSTSVEFDARRDTPTGHSVDRAKQAADDMKKMDEAVRKATEQ